MGVAETLLELDRQIVGQFARQAGFVDHADGARVDRPEQVGAPDAGFGLGDDRVCQGRGRTAANIQREIGIALFDRRQHILVQAAFAAAEIKREFAFQRGQFVNRNRRGRLRETDARRQGQGTHGA